MSWELWVDYHRCDAEGLTHASVKDVSSGVSLVEGGYFVVGNEEADLAVGEVVSIDERGIVLVRVLPGSFDDHRHLLPNGYASPG
jgi:hypothetical protein